jgi:hypothetical protein
MGGGAAMNYAARHLDPSGVRFAAVFNQSGILSHEDTYPQTDPIVTAIYDTIFGTGGAALPFPMQRSSVFSFDPQTQAVDLGTDLGRNLLHIATHSTRTSGDVPYLITQNDLFHSYLLARGADPTRHLLTQVNYPGHSWDAVSEKSVCDWLRGFALTEPSSTTTLADRDGRFFHFDVVQTLAGSFTPFDWAVDTANNRVTIAGTANLLAIAVDLSSAGLSAANALLVDVGTADGLADEIRIDGWSSTPSGVLRDGIATASWLFDALNARVTLLEFDGGGHTWTVVP